MLLIWSERRHRKGLAARPFERIVGVVARNAHLPLGFLVVRLQVGIADGPVFQGASFYSAVGRAHPEISFHVAPGHGAIAESATADAGRVVAVSAFTRAEEVFLPVLYQYARIAVLVRTESVAQHRGALIAQVVFAAVGGRVPLAAFQQHHAQAGCG